MGPITVLRGFKIPVAILDRFLEANRVEPTYGYPPFYHRSEPDAGSRFLREKLQAAGDTKTRIFIPQLQGELDSTYAYVAYAWVMVYAQRRLELAEELPDRAPPGFAELRVEMLGHANGGDVELLQVRRLEEGVEDPTSALFVVVAEERPYSFQSFPRKSDLRCDRCDVVVDKWELRQAHRREVHGLEYRDLPEF
ncbi:uncharacterized protein B0H64DRAFT_59494 [Chaetomium fimeti]|uniref:C2H2-type domain-containing protein n=1 Tax=Chaetomium fimeti TaxID=1854472 RepID=A0AAE0LMD5_9PEZI|nr:hypothetical protein B0H64DRAFT_59494 [Chaetomium fimeti]